MPRELRVGTRIGEYEIKRVLGQGGFGITYLAHDENLARDVAIKEYFPREFAHRETGCTVVPSQDEQERADFDWGMRHFIEEARSLTRFRHKNIVGAIGFIRDNGTAYLVMEYCDGESLEALAKRVGPLPVHVLMPIVNQLLDALEEVHRVRLLHLDVKPSNIFVKQDGTVVLLDFGSVRQAISSHTKSVMVGSPGYAAPEQGSNDVDARARGPWTDIYGLGATLYRLMSGSRPQEAMARLQDDRLLALSSLTELGYSSGLVDMVNASLRLKPHDRPQSVNELRKLASSPNIYPNPTPNPSPDSPPASPTEQPFSWMHYAALTCAASGVIYLIVIALSTTEESPTVVEVPPTDILPGDEPSSTPRENPEPVTDRPVVCPEGQGFKEYAEGTLTWDECFGVVSSGGYKFSGIWKKGKKFDGTEVYADAESRGHRYVGRFKDNLRHGEGKSFYTNGDRYVGRFKDNLPHGEGKYFWTDGDRYEGSWESGKRSGRGTYTFKSGNKFVGMYRDDKENGPGILYDAAGVVVLTGTWANGELQDPNNSTGNASPGAAASAKNLYIDVTNSTAYVFHYIYVKSRGSDSWGSDRLGETIVLEVGETYRVQLPNSLETIFDVRVCDGGLNEYLRLGVNAETSNVEVKLTDLTHSKCIL